MARDVWAVEKCWDNFGEGWESKIVALRSLEANGFALALVQAKEYVAKERRFRPDDNIALLVVSTDTEYGVDVVSYRDGVEMEEYRWRVYKFVDHDLS